VQLVTASVTSKRQGAIAYLQVDGRCSGPRGAASRCPLRHETTTTICPLGTCSLAAVRDRGHASKRGPAIPARYSGAYCGRPTLLLNRDGATSTPASQQACLARDAGQDALHRLRTTLCEPGGLRRFFTWFALVLSRVGDGSRKGLGRPACICDACRAGPLHRAWLWLSSSPSSESEIQRGILVGNNIARRQTEPRNTNTQINVSAIDRPGISLGTSSDPDSIRCMPMIRRRWPVSYTVRSKVRKVFFSVVLCCGRKF
jgi:hypothetical protein